MPLAVNIAGVWKTGNAVAVRVGGVWKSATPYVRVGGVWKSAAIGKVAAPSVSKVEFPDAPSNMTAQAQLTCATEGATIYTSVGNGDWGTYWGSVTVPPGQNLRAYATKAGMADSDILGPITF